MIALRGIHKRFGPVHANRGVTLEVAPGSIHGLIGENGAGKSTLMGILCGLHPPDEGTIEVDGHALKPGSARDAIAAGIGMVHQHFMLVDRFTVLENIVLGAEQGFVLARGLAAARREVLRLAAEFGLEVDPDAVAGELPVGVLQRVEILKALYRGARVLILDEPTGVLTPQEADQLMRMLRQLKSRGTTVLLITHKLREVLVVTDRVTVMRAGEVVATRETAATTEAELAELMVGRKVRLGREGTPAPPGAVVLSARGLGWRDAQGVVRFSGIDLDLRQGEIVGVAGVSGNGQSELLELLAGLRPLQSGEIRLAADGDRPAGVWPLDPHRLRQLGVAHVPEDRQRWGLVLEFEAWESAALGYTDDAAIARGPAMLGLLDPRAMRAQCAEMMAAFDVRPPDPAWRSAKFSGGNQQKLVIARELRRAPRLLLIGQPTRGVDIGAIETIHRALRRLRDAGCAVLLVSTELDEILALADRIVVMSQGRITGEMARDAADEVTIGRCMGQGGAAA